MPGRTVAPWARSDLELLAAPLVGGRGAWNGGAGPPEDSPLSHAETDAVWKKWRSLVRSRTDADARTREFTQRQRVLVHQLEQRMSDVINEQSRRWFWVICGVTAPAAALIRPALESGTMAYTANVENKVVVAVPELALTWRDAFARTIPWIVIDDVRDRDDATVAELIADLWDPTADGSAADLSSLVAVARRLL